MSRDEPTDRQIQELIAVAQAFGRDPQLVPAGGGEASFKTERHLLISAAGTSLAEAGPGSFVRLDRQRLAALWDRSYPEEPQRREAAVLADLAAAREAGQQALQPSAESSLHELLPEPYVVHAQPALVNGLACSREGPAAAARLFGDRVLWVPAVHPSHVPAAAVRQAVREYQGAHGQGPDILVLQNHGLIVSGRSLRDLQEKTAFVIDALRREVRELPPAGQGPGDRERAAALAPALRMLLWQEAPSSVVSFAADALIAGFLRDERSFAGVSTALTPQHILHCNAEPLFVPRREALEEQYALLAAACGEYRQRHGFGPKVVAVQHLGVFGWGPSRRSAEAAVALFHDALQVLLYSRSFGGPQPLPAGPVRFIVDREAELSRQELSAAPAARGRLAEKIAVVTGAAQGFGLGLAEALLAEGANVVLADLNGELAAQQAAALAPRFPGGRVQALRVDVGAEDSVREMIVATVLAYGGLDLYVSNAGLLRAGGLEELPAETFEAVNRVNYTGYFFGCKHAARPMRIQRRFAPDYTMDIVQINSKSGLSGSNRNFAYAGSKFAAIGLTQSFALELVEEGIKVNSICPGNYFDGPLWSDPDNGLFVQYLRAGKVPGARSLQDVRRYYEQKVPMGRGCRVQDVARALFYLVEQQYETGQALPVTGGQIMLK